MAKKAMNLNKGMRTPFESDGARAWDEYPRPQMRRDSYLPLNGEWDLYVSEKHKDDKYLGKINVPFVPESRLSGIEREKGKYEMYIYKKSIILDDDFVKDRVILHIGAADQVSRVFVNGNAVGGQVGGYLPYSLDITDSIHKGKNLIEINVIDELDTEYAYGKQRVDRGGMWYTPISGIWQSVWCESVPKSYIKGIKITPLSLSCVRIEVDAPAGERELVLRLPGGDKTYSFSSDFIDIEVDDPINWTPDDPYLYRFTLRYGDDEIESYFALRTVGTEEKNGRKYIALNGEPILCHGLLDQGYFSDGIYLPASPRGFENDILTMKSLGFNMLRKHIKIEPELFYYYCDKYGMLVFQDMVNSGKYSFLLDTALPTIGLKRGISHKASDTRREAFEHDSAGTLDLLHNHPSVIYYTIFNEGWGQYDADRIYGELKAYDGTRIYDTASGWFRPHKSDVDSEHIYFRKLRMKNGGSRPLVLSEFGGYSCKLEEHSFNLDNTYGYRDIKGLSEFEDAFVSLYDTQVIPHIREQGLCALVYTQVSDVEDETNGLFTYDRQVLKVNKEKIKAMSDRLYRAFDEVTK